MPPTILPERTVDMWTATYLSGRAWRVRLWAPTERGVSERYDLAAGLRRVGAGPGRRAEEPTEKVFVLEHKGVRAGQRVCIAGKQLEAHLAADEAAGGGLVYYLLPALARQGEKPHGVWGGPHAAPYGKVPGAVEHRLRGPQLPSGTGREWLGFQLWAVVVPVQTLAAWLRESGRQPELERGLACLPAPELWDLPDRLPLRDFVSAVRDCRCGRRTDDPDLVDFLGGFAAEERERQRPPRGEASYTTFYGVGGLDRLCRNSGGGEPLS